jgi:hypothetical protein
MQAFGMPRARQVSAGGLLCWLLLEMFQYLLRTPSTQIIRDDKVCIISLDSETMVGI